MKNNNQYYPVVGSVVLVDEAKTDIEDIAVTPDYCIYISEDIFEAFKDPLQAFVKKLAEKENADKLEYISKIEALIKLDGRSEKNKICKFGFVINLSIQAFID